MPRSSRHAFLISHLAFIRPSTLRFTLAITAHPSCRSRPVQIPPPLLPTRTNY
ncbi:hypothetical protein FA13DRAFT_1738093 [Coprinellus micaceus]|uniref:Uncharacterized protein n=1 Tax=Coprinellus micaceus TaxID=71717 RepID=A0A4Y7SWZ9_COPMI|nr:hypothetical protein FA13DRAFT_1738093 [Coprinellus micaceus]